MGFVLPKVNSSEDFSNRISIKPDFKREIFKRGYLGKNGKIVNQHGVSLTPLRPLKQLKHRGMMTFDCETKDGLKGKELYCWSLCYYTASKKGQDSTIEVLTGKEDLKPLFEKIKCNDKRFSMARIIYVHNLGFDVRFIIDYCVRHKIQYSDPIINGFFISLYINELNVKFVDSYQFILSSQDIAEIDYEVDQSLRKIDCKAIFNKKYESWTNEEKELVIQHNQNDVKALMQIMDKLRKTWYENANVDILQSISLASLSMKAFRKTLEKPIDNPFVNIERKKGLDGKMEKPIYTYEKDKEAFVRKSYFGGRTEVFDKDKHDKVSVIDKVSMYPHVMKIGTFPKGFGQTIDNKIILMNIINGNMKGKEGFIECKITPLEYLKYPVFPIRLDNKVMFTNCTIQNVYALPELRYAFEIGKYKIEPIRGFIFDSTTSYFDKFVSKFFKIKSENKGAKKKVAKICLNGCYGKFGQEFERRAIKYNVFTSKEKALDYIEEQDSNEVMKIIKNPNEDIWVIPTPVESTIIKPFMNVCIASYITSYARIELVKLLHYCEQMGIEVFYCDTDSIFIETQYLDKIKLGTDLGNWDLDKQFDSIRIKAPKCYYGIEKGKIKLKMKGIDKDKIDEIVKKAKNMDEIEEMITKPIELAEKYMQYNESLRNGQILGTKKLSKIYSFENNKRDFDERGKSVAWNDETIPDKYASELYSLLM